MVKKRRLMTIHVDVTVPEGVTRTQVKREIKSRVNEGCCYILDEEDVKVRSCM